MIRRIISDVRYEGYIVRQQAEIKRQAKTEGRKIPSELEPQSISGLRNEAVDVLTEFSHLIRKALSKKIDMKFLPKVYFVGDKSFDYAEKIEKLIQKNK